MKEIEPKVIDNSPTTKNEPKPQKEMEKRTNIKEKEKKPENKEPEKTINTSNDQGTQTETTPKTENEKKHEMKILENEEKPKGKGTEDKGTQTKKENPKPLKTYGAFPISF